LFAIGRSDRKLLGEGVQVNENPQQRLIFADPQFASMRSRKARDANGRSPELWPSPLQWRIRGCTGKLMRRETSHHDLKENSTMSGTASDDRTGTDPAAGGSGDPLARAAAQGPIFTDDDETDSSNLEAPEAHDSPAAVDEERAAEETTDDSDRLRSIYGPPPGERS